MFSDYCLVLMHGRCSRHTVRDNTVFNFFSVVSPLSRLGPDTLGNGKYERFQYDQEDAEWQNWVGELSDSSADALHWAELREEEEIQYRDYLRRCRHNDTRVRNWNI